MNVREIYMHNEVRGRPKILCK